MSSLGNDQLALDNTSTPCFAEISAKIEVILREMEGKFRKVQSHMILDLFKGKWETNEDGSQFISFADRERHDGLRPSMLPRHLQIHRRKVSRTEVTLPP